MPCPVYSGYVQTLVTNPTGNTVYIHFQWIYGKLGNQGIPVKTSQHIRTLQYRKLRLFDLFIFPSGCRQLILRYLKGIAQQRVVLIQILHILWF